MRWKAGRAMVIAINKWDNMNTTASSVSLMLSAVFDFYSLARIHADFTYMVLGWVSYIHQFTVLMESANLKVSPAKLTQILNDATDQHQPPTVQGRRIKMRYAHMEQKSTDYRDSR
ncbi:hypothetical protein ABVN80_04655 [Acinetobacter baumannii]